MRARENEENMSGRKPWRRVVLGALGLVAGCHVTPLSNRIQVGEEPFVVVVAEGRNHETDLFATSAGGGTFVQFTFNRLVESEPRLSPQGTLLVFLRAETAGQSAGAQVVVLDLLTGSEHTSALPPGGWPERLGWSGDGKWVYLRAPDRIFYAADPEHTPLVFAPVDTGGAGAADSATSELLGNPVFGAVSVCEGGMPCIRTSGGAVTELGAGVRDPFRWGPDSVAYLRDSRIEVRPLGGGRPREVLWREAPANLRQPTYHPGAGRPTASENGLVPPS